MADQRGTTPAPEVRAAWGDDYAAWAQKHPDLEQLLNRMKDRRLPEGWADDLPSFPADEKGMATRKASGGTIQAIAATVPELWGGSADLAESNNTTIEGVPSFLPDARATKMWSADPLEGRVLHFGIREHGMGAIMNGIAVHGGTRVFGGTFLTFSDYMRGAVRVAALMKVPVTYVWTHDSIGLGEDGPTHQPVEHLAALRAIPNMRVFRPCDAIEVAECWELALNRTTGPTVLVLTRQNLPQLRTSAPADNPCAHGAYELVAAGGDAKVSFFATGSEVEIAVNAQKQLAERGIASRVVSIPSLELLLEQPIERQRAIIGNAPVKVGIEAAVRWGWDAVIGKDGVFIGMHGFGESGKAKDLFKHFNITAEAAVEAVMKRLGTA